MKKQFILFGMLSFFFIVRLSAQVAINTDGSQAESSAGLDVKFTDRGFYPPG